MVEATIASGDTGLQLDGMHDRKLEVTERQIPVFLPDRYEGFFAPFPLKEILQPALYSISFQFLSFAVVPNLW